MRLKELFEKKTGGAIDVFLSSDGESIPLGSNWVHRIEQALESAKIMFVFVSQNSIHSHWLYFEAGYSYHKKAEPRVIPLGFQGVDLTQIGPPLSLLQGFNIRSAESLDNLIYTVNETFGHTHSERFTSQEYDDLVALSAPAYNTGLGVLESYIEDVFVSTACDHNKFESSREALAYLEAQFVEQKIRCQSIGDEGGFLAVHFEGATASWGYGETEEQINISIDPTVLEPYKDTLKILLDEVGSKGVQGSQLLFRFKPQIDALTELHKITARLRNTAAMLHTSYGITFHELVFWFGRNEFADNPNIDLYVRVEADELPMSRIRELLGLLASCGVLYLKS
jgi:hypothetical protein